MKKRCITVKSTPGRAFYGYADARVISHNLPGPVSTAACPQICATSPSLGIQELPAFCLNVAKCIMVRQPIQFRDGFLLIPEAPGIGGELSEEAETLYPAKERGSTAAFCSFDGAVKDW